MIDDQKEVFVLDPAQIKEVISRLIFEIEKLKDENESLWILLEEIETMNIEGREILSSSLKNLKLIKQAYNKRPEQA